MSKRYQRYEDDVIIKYTFGRNQSGARIVQSPKRPTSGAIALFLTSLGTHRTAASVRGRKRVLLRKCTEQLFNEERALRSFCSNRQQQYTEVEDYLIVDTLTRLKSGTCPISNASIEQSIQSVLKRHGFDRSLLSVRYHISRLWKSNQRGQTVR